MGKTSKIRRWVGITMLHQTRKILFGLILIVPCAASANVVNQNLFEQMGDETQIALITASAVFGTAGLVFAIANHVEIASDERPNYFWRVGGYSSGGINAAFGIFYVVCALISIKGNTPNSDSWLWLGMSHVVIGGASIGLAAWGGSISEENTPSVTLAPLIMPDARGNAAFGVGLQLVDW